MRARGVSRPGTSPQPGTVLGSYRILSLLGEGAVGRVYLAEHTKLGRKVALKMLKGELSNHPKLVKRFFIEAKAVNDVAHENIVTITDFVEDENQPAYFIMELLQGRTLEDLIRNEGPQPIEVVASIGAQLTSALAAVHAQGVVHRDLKPANVFLVPRGSGWFVKLLDFGVAKLVAANKSTPSDTTAFGDLVGTPDYMSPEQARAMTIDHRADIYALGILLYEMVTGERPLNADSLENILKAQIFEVPPPASTKAKIPRELDELISKCMEKEPADRPQSAAEVRAVLEVFDRPPRRWWQEKRAIAAAIAVVPLAIVLWAVYSTSAEPTLPPPPPPPPPAPAPLPALSEPKQEPAPVLERVVEPEPQPAPDVPKRKTKRAKKRPSR